MDDDLRRGFKRTIRRRSPDIASGEGQQREKRQEWEGTGLCAEAQADGVPCYELGRSCDECGRAKPR
jgi:hypothetical protein